MSNAKEAFTPQDVEYMRLALEQAREAVSHGDVPVGAVLVCDTTGETVAVGCNTRELQGSATGHAEVNAIQAACEKLGRWRLSDCTLYVTLEPCPMCTGAILSARIPRVVCGAKDAVAGAMGSVWSLHTHPATPQTTRISYGCLDSESRTLLQDFFQSKRK